MSDDEQDDFGSEAQQAFQAPSSPVKKKVAVKQKSVMMGPVVETAEDKYLREKRERLLEIKAKLAEPGGNFGVAIMNNGKSYNKFSTKSYDELAQIQKDENKFRKLIGMKEFVRYSKKMKKKTGKPGFYRPSLDKRKINNTEKGFKPNLDPKFLRAALLKEEAYNGGGKLNMVEVIGQEKALKVKLEEKY